MLELAPRMAPDKQQERIGGAEQDRELDEGLATVFSDLVSVIEGLRHKVRRTICWKNSYIFLSWYLGE